MANDDLLDQLGEFLSKGTQNIRDRLTMDVTDLLRAIDKNDPEAVERALRARVDPNATDGIRRRALPIAVDNNSLLIVQLLLKAGADPNLPDPFGDTPLFKAVYWENESIIKVLLAADADIHQPAANGQSPLEEARKMSNGNLVTILETYHDKAREVRIDKDRSTHEEMKKKAEAARQEREEKLAAEKLAAEKAATEAAEKKRAEAEEEVAKKYSIDPDNYPKTLIEAIRSGDTKGAQILLEKTDDINAYVPEYRNTPLFAAIENKNTTITSLLIEKGADTLTLNLEKQHSALSLAVSIGAYKLVSLILEKKEGQTAASLNNPEQLLSAQFLAYKDPKMLHLLLKAGANPFFGGKHGQAPIIKAIEKGSLGVLPALVTNKVDLNYRYQNRTPLEWAIHFRRIEWVSALLDEQVNPDTQDDQGNTPLLFAIELNIPEVVQLLIEEEAAIHLRNQKGQTAAELAQELGNREEILKLLT